MTNSLIVECNEKISILDHDNIVEYLIDKGAEVNSKNNRGNTALHTAAMEGFKFYFIFFCAIA